MIDNPSDRLTLTMQLSSVNGLPMAVKQTTLPMPDGDHIYVTTFPAGFFDLDDLL